MSITVATWNVEWATPASDRGPRIAGILDATESDTIVLTEGVRELLPASGYVLDAGGDWGYGSKPTRRKVIVWSRYPLSMNLLGEEGATRGRLVIATAAAPDGPVRVIGVCIPWQDAHVRDGRGDAQRWSEHLDFLDRLEQILAALDGRIPTVIAGDFNQRIPRFRQPAHVFERLAEVLSGWTIHTAGELPNGLHIDHIATNRRLALESVRDWGASDDLGRLSDHGGVSCRLVIADAAAPEAAEASHSERAIPMEDIVIDDEAVAVPDPVADHHDSAESLTPELRKEIESILRRSSDGLEHGAAFRLREQGLTVAEIAAARGVKVGSTRVWLRSLDHLLTGTLPTSKTPAEDNSYGYRELLNHARSDELDRYVMFQLRKLKEINPDVKFSPLNTRPYPYQLGKSRPQREADFCSCGMQKSSAGTCDYCD